MNRTIAASALALLATLLLAPAAASAQTTPATPPAPAPTQEQDEPLTGWKELDEFHATMAAAWHPAVRSNDLAPARQQADSLLARARAWAASAVPTKCDTPQILSARRDVVTNSERVAQLVTARAADAEVKQALKETHDRFHVVEEHCHP